MRTVERLQRLEVYAYRRWQASGHASAFWYNLTAACNRAVKAHPDYRGLR